MSNEIGEYNQYLSPRARVNQYEIESVLGIGGFGITYKGFDHQLHTTVAIKEYLPADFAVRGQDSISVQPRRTGQADNYAFGLTRFLEEARVLAKFKHPNIVRVTNFLESNNTAYLIMDYEDGESLERHLAGRERPLSEEELRTIFIPVMEGLRAVHAANFLHRDLKPANIYLRKQGGPMLIDFGAARQAVGAHTRAMTGFFTPGYTPFEQYDTRGKFMPATDIYGLGATLYDCLTGQLPPEAPARINALNESEPDPFVPTAQAAQSGYSQMLLETVDWMLRPFPRDRPQTIEIVLERLREPPVSGNKRTVARKKDPSPSEPADTSAEERDPHGVGSVEPVDYGEKGNAELGIAVARLGTPGHGGQATTSDAPQKKLSVRWRVGLVVLVGWSVLIWGAYLWLNKSSPSVAQPVTAPSDRPPLPEPTAEDKSDASTNGPKASGSKEYTYEGRQITLAPEAVFEITGKVESASPTLSEYGSFSVHVRFKDNAKQALKEFSEKNLNQQAGFTSRGKLVSLAVVRAPLSNGYLEISGGLSQEESLKIASELGRDSGEHQNKNSTWRDWFPNF